MADGTTKKDSVKGNIMSHYAVAVFCDHPNRYSFDDLLAPYRETDKSYYTFTPVTDEEIQRKWEKFSHLNPKWTRKQFLKNMFHFDENSNRYGYYYNHNAKYDYYYLDGKSYLYDALPRKRKTNGFYKKSQIDWFASDDDKSADEYAKEWEEYSTNGDGFYKKEYYTDRYNTCEQYVKEMMRPTPPYGFVTPDGKWHSPGNVGPFASSDETSESADAYWDEWVDFIMNGPDCFVSICDFHI